MNCYRYINKILLRVYKYYMAIRNCGIYFCVFEQEDGKMEWPSLLENDKLKLPKHLPDRFGDCQPAEIFTEVKTLWKVTI